MLTITLPYGHSLLEAQLPYQEAILLQPPITTIKKEEELIRKSLAQPLASPPLYSLAHRKKKAVIIISDQSRPVPSSKFLPYLLEELKIGGLDYSSITIIIARGTHRELTRKEMEELVGRDVFQKVLCLSSTPQADDHINLGHTSLGTPIKVFRPILEADLKIVTGNLDFHRLTGFSAGIKGLFLGAACQESIAHNHGLSLSFSTSPGQLENNPIRKDMEEFAEKVGVDFLFNVIVDYQHRIVAAFAGDPYEAHRQGCCQLAELFQVPVDRPADVVIASPGGFPKDINLYQTVKTLQNSLSILKPGGTIILAAQCPEDYGNPTLALWSEKFGATQETRKHLEKRFILGAHKLKYFAEINQKAQVKMITDLPEQVLAQLKIKKLPTLQEAFDETFETFTQDQPPHILVLPYGGFILPALM